MIADHFNVIARNLNAMWPHDDSWLAGMAASTVWASVCQNVEDIFRVICHGHAVSTSERDDRALAVAEGILNFE
jgi:hypothetical protein